LYTRLNDYNTKPNPKFKGNREHSYINGYLGFELECEPTEIEDWDDINTDETCEEVCAIMGRDVYCKYDGSLESGIEIVSHPMTLEYLENTRFDFARMSDYLVEDGWRSHDAPNCGLHFHVSRTALGDNPDAAEARIMYLFEKFWNKIVKFSRRKDSELHWCDRNFGGARCTINECAYIANNQKGWGHSSRYHAINVTNDDTIEFRIFKGTLKPNTYRASVEFCLRVVDYILHTEENTETWKGFMTYKQLPQSMVQYMTERHMQTTF
jgi:hypothetical protein